MSITIVFLSSSDTNNVKIVWGVGIETSHCSTKGTLCKAVWNRTATKIAITLNCYSWTSFMFITLRTSVISWQIITSWCLHITNFLKLTPENLLKNVFAQVRFCFKTYPGNLPKEFFVLLGNGGRKFSFTRYSGYRALNLCHQFN